MSTTSVFAQLMGTALNRCEETQTRMRRQTDGWAGLSAMRLLCPLASISWRLDKAVAVLATKEAARMSDDQLREIATQINQASLRVEKLLSGMKSAGVARSPVYNGLLATIARRQDELTRIAERIHLTLNPEWCEKAVE